MNSRDGIRAGFAAVLCIAGLGWTPVRALCDTTAPALTAFSFTPSTINTTLGSQTVTCNMTLTDALSGVTSATCTFTSPAPALAYRQSCTAVAPTSGTTQNGVWSCVITFPRYSQSGSWTAGVTGGAAVSGVSATDAVGNSASINPADQGLPSVLTITSDPDVIAPALTTFTVPPGAVNVSAAPQNVTCNMTLTDAKSGVAFASCQLSAPAASSTQTAACGAAAPTSGTRNNGLFSCVATIPRYADAGTWTSAVLAIDQVGNIASLPSATTLAVTAVPEDIVVPSLVLATSDFNPKTISVGGGSKSVVCTMGVADSPAGVNTATCSFSIFGFTPEFDLINQRQSCTATVPFSGTRNSGTFQCTVVIPRYAAGGMWDWSVSLDDLAGNSFNYMQTLKLNVSCDAGDLETTCRFANRTTLTWDAVAGATRYNVYRGPQSNLIDTAPPDHLPDLGYGTCLAFPTVTTLVDPVIASVSEKGFFYLVSYKLGGVEKGLGTNSFGTVRTVASPCP